MNRRIATVLLVVTVIGSIAWIVRNRGGDSNRDAIARALEVQHSESEDQPQAAPLETSVAMRADERSIVAAAPDTPGAATEPAEVADDHVIFGRVSCASTSKFDPTHCRVRVTPTVGRAVDVLPDAAGDYEVRDLSNGPCSVRVSIDGFAPFEQSVWLTASEQRVRVDIPLQSVRSLHVFLRDTSGRAFIPARWSDDRSILGGSLTLVFTRELPVIGRQLGAVERIAHETKLVDRGENRDANAPWFDVVLPSGMSGYACVLLDEVVLDATRVPIDGTDVTLVAALSTRVGRVEALVVDDATGVAVQALTMTLRSSGPGWNFGSTSHSDAHGLVFDDWVRPGRVHVTIRAPRFAVFERDVDVVARQVTKLGEVRLAPAISIAGVALLPSGARAVYRELCRWANETEPGAPIAIGVVYTNAEGEFRFDSLKPGVYVIGKYSGEVDIADIEPIFTTGIEATVRGALDASKARVFARIDATHGNVENVTITVDDQR